MTEDRGQKAAERQESGWQEVRPGETEQRQLSLAENAGLLSMYLAPSVLDFGRYQSMSIM
jgi:hypothetical protein